MDEAEIHECVALIAHDESAEITQPGEEPFDFLPPTVASATARLPPEHGTSLHVDTLGMPISVSVTTTDMSDMIFSEQRGIPQPSALSRRWTSTSNGEGRSVTSMMGRTGASSALEKRTL